MDIMSLYPTGMIESRKQEIKNRMESLERQMENCRYTDTTIAYEIYMLEKELNEIDVIS